MFKKSNIIILKKDTNHVTFFKILPIIPPLTLPPPPHTHTHTYTHTHARTHAHTHTHARTHARTHTTRSNTAPSVLVARFLRRFRFPLVALPARLLLLNPAHLFDLSQPLPLPSLSSCLIAVPEAALSNPPGIALRLGFLAASLCLQLIMASRDGPPPSHRPY